MTHKAAVECYKFFRPLLRQFSKRLFDFERNVILSNIKKKMETLEKLVERVRLLKKKKHK